MLPNNIPPGYAYDLRHLSQWIVENANHDPIDQAIGRLLQHIAYGYGGLFCDGVGGVDKYMRRANGLSHDRLILFGERLAITVMLNHHAPRPPLRPWQTKIGYGGRLLAGATWLKDSTTALDQVARAIARLLDHIAEHYEDVVINGRDHHDLLIKYAKQVLFAVIAEYPRRDTDPEKEATDLLRGQLVAPAPAEPKR